MKISHMFNLPLAHLPCKYAGNICGADTHAGYRMSLFVSQEHSSAALVLLDPPIVFQCVKRPQRIEIQFARAKRLFRWRNSLAHSEHWSITSKPQRIRSSAARPSPKAPHQQLTKRSVHVRRRWNIAQDERVGIRLCWGLSGNWLSGLNRPKKDTRRLPLKGNAEVRALAEMDLFLM